MFRRKPEITVIKVKHEKRNIEDESSFTKSYGYMSSGDTVRTVKKYKSDVTIVLLVKDGDLVTREFNGSWDLEDIKTWEEV